MARRGRPPREKRELSVPGLRSLGLLAAFFPPPTVDRILGETDRVKQRTRLLPSRLVVYYVLPMALYAREGYRELYRLVTTILDPDRTPTRELAALYSKRWEVEISIKELKIYRGRPNVVLRSRKPNGVLQEVYGFATVHYTIRWLLHHASLEQGPRS